MIRCFMSLLTLFESYRDDGRVIMKALCNEEPYSHVMTFSLQQDSNSGPRDQVRNTNYSASVMLCMY